MPWLQFADHTSIRHKIDQLFSGDTPQFNESHRRLPQVHFKTPTELVLCQTLYLELWSL